MPRYLVEWHINIDADTPRQAAQKALEIHRDSSSLATIFQVTEHDTFTDPVDIDLFDGQEDEDNG